MIKPLTHWAHAALVGLAVLLLAVVLSTDRAGAQEYPFDNVTLVVPYGTQSAVEITLTDVMDKMVVDDWGQCKGGKLGSLRAHVESGKLSEESLHAELCQIVTGERPSRERDGETILFWHRGLSLSDVALGAAMLEKAGRLGIGQRLRYA